MPQLIGGIFIVALVITFVAEFWKYIIGIFLFVVVTALIAYEFFYVPAAKDKSDSEKEEIQNSYLRRNFLCIFLALAAFFMFQKDISNLVNKINFQQKAVQQTKTPEQIQAEKDAEKLKNQIEHVSKLTGEDKNFYDTKFKEYINAGQDENSAREKALADLTEMQKQKFEEQRKAEEERKKAEEEQKRQAQVEKAKAEQAEREKNYLANNYNEIYQWCYWMFYKIGYSDDVLQYHMNSGDEESIRDLKFVMNKFVSDLNDDWKYSIATNVPDNIRSIMLSARNNLQKSFELRKNGNRSEIQQSNQLENEVVQQLIQIQQMLPEGVKMWSYQGIYDPNDELDIPSEYRNNGRVTIQIDDGEYFQ